MSRRTRPVGLRCALACIAALAAVSPATALPAGAATPGCSMTAHCHAVLGAGSTSSGVAVTAIVATPVAARALRPQQQGANEPTAKSVPLKAAASGQSTDGVVASVTPDGVCSLDAVTTLPPTADHRIAESPLDPASQAKPSTPALSRSDAISTARSMALPVEQAVAQGQAAPDTTAYPTAVAQVPYAVGNIMTGGSRSDDSVVAPTRCVWVVTVHAPYQPASVPPGVKPTTFRSYTTIFDVASGEYLGLAAGAYGTDIITGAGESAK